MKCILICLLLVLWQSPVHAGQTVRGGNVIIDHPVYDNLYVTGGTITINAPVHGDLIAMAGTITINDSVMGDMVLVAGNITLNGFAGDDVRCMGGTVTILKSVAGEVAASCGNIEISKGATVKSLIALAGKARMAGLVLGSFKGEFGDLTLDGDVLGNVECKGRTFYFNGAIDGFAVISATENITVGTNAHFMKPLRYWTPQKRIRFNGAISNGSYFDKNLKIGSEEWYFLGFSSLIAVLWYMAMVATTILLIQYLFSATMKKAARSLGDNFGKMLAYGILFLVSVPVLAVLVCVTIVGLPVGLILMLGYGLLLALSTSVSAVVISNLIHQQKGAKGGLLRIGLTAMGIFVALKIISFIPIVGFLLTVVIIAVCIGAIVYCTKKSITARIDHKHSLVDAHH